MSSFGLLRHIPGAFISVHFLLEAKQREQTKQEGICNSVLVVSLVRVIKPLRIQHRQTSMSQLRTAPPPPPPNEFISDKYEPCLCHLRVCALFFIFLARRFYLRRVWCVFLIKIQLVARFSPFKLDVRFVHFVIHFIRFGIRFSRWTFVLHRQHSFSKIVNSICLSSLNFDIRFIQCFFQVFRHSF